MSDNSSSDRRFAPKVVYIVFEGGEPVRTFSDEDEAHSFKSGDEYVMTYEMAGDW